MGDKLTLRLIDLAAGPCFICKCGLPLTVEFLAQNYQDWYRTASNPEMGEDELGKFMSKRTLSLLTFAKCPTHQRLYVALATYIRWYTLITTHYPARDELYEFCSTFCLACRAQWRGIWRCPSARIGSSGCPFLYTCRAIDSCNFHRPFKIKLLEAIEEARCAVLYEARKLGMYSAWRHIPAVSASSMR
jgi:hypothetical protein